jgi:hypothetical protein
VVASHERGPREAWVCYNESCMLATGEIISRGSSFFTTTHELFRLAFSREML